MSEGRNADAIALRPATAVDVDAVTAVVNAAYRVERFFVDGDRTDADEVRSLLATGSFLVADEGRIVGSVYVEIRGARGYFALLAVAPERKGSGLGRRLVAAAEDYCRAAGCTDVDIEIVNLRAELPRFYHSLGYAETGTAPFPEDTPTKQPCHFVTMSKRLR